MNFNNIDFFSPPIQLYNSTEFQNSEIEGGNFLKGVKWSPDGTCFLSNSSDNILRIFSIPPDCYNSQDKNNPITNSINIHSVISCKEAEDVYDFTWFPQMSSTDPTSCVFATTTRDHPIHLWDACTGTIRSSYSAYHPQTGEIMKPISLQFNINGDKLYAGAAKSIIIFDISKPGRRGNIVSTWNPHKKIGHRGIISTIVFSSFFHNIYACGSYSGEFFINDENSNNSVLSFPKKYHPSGVSYLLFYPNVNHNSNPNFNQYILFSGGRHESNIYCWDIRNSKNPVVSFDRSTAKTSQRLYFDICKNKDKNYLISGAYDIDQNEPQLRLFDLENLEKYFDNYDESNNNIQDEKFQEKLNSNLNFSSNQEKNVNININIADEISISSENNFNYKEKNFNNQEKNNTTDKILSTKSNNISTSTESNNISTSTESNNISTFKRMKYDIYSSQNTKVVPHINPIQVFTKNKDKNLYQSLDIHNDIITCVSIHSKQPFILTCSGQRKFKNMKELSDSDVSDEDVSEDEIIQDNRIILWYMNSLE